MQKPAQKREKSTYGCWTTVVGNHLHWEISIYLGAGFLHLADWHLTLLSLKSFCIGTTWGYKKNSPDLSTAPYPKKVGSRIRYARILLTTFPLHKYASERSKLVITRAGVTQVENDSLGKSDLLCMVCVSIFHSMANAVFPPSPPLSFAQGSAPTYSPSTTLLSQNRKCTHYDVTTALFCRGAK